MDDIGPILMMAIVAVVVCTLVVGVTLDAISSYGLVVCLLLGAIVATTDPVAVVGIFREVGAPKRLTTLVEGESLFNDARPSPCTPCCWPCWAAMANSASAACSMISWCTSSVAAWPVSPWGGWPVSCSPGCAASPPPRSR